MERTPTVGGIFRAAAGIAIFIGPAPKQETALISSSPNRLLVDSTKCLQQG
jgi:hypothetical protein